jgi:hypothetical protein
MIDLFFLLLFGVGWIWGVHCLLSEGYLFDKVGHLIDRLPEFLSKPLYQCPPCQSSIHGIVIFFIFSDQDWYYVFLYVLALAGVNYIIKEFLYPEI